MTSARRPGCTLEAYAVAKGLDIDFLRSLGARDATYGGIAAAEIPYWSDRVGGEQPTSRFRIVLDGTDKFRSPKGKRLELYGLWRLEEAWAAGRAFLVEGESDAQTLWQAGVPAIGIPGASSWRDEWAKPLEAIEQLILVAEPDTGGRTLTAAIAASPLQPRVRVVALAPRSDKEYPAWMSVKYPAWMSVKDVSELWLADPDQRRFVLRLEAAITDATPLAAPPPRPPTKAEREAERLRAAAAEMAAAVDAEDATGRKRPLDADDRPRPRPRSEVDPAAALADEWLIDSLVRPGRLLVVGGPEGLGKTQAIREMAIRLATGHGALFNHYRIPEARRVLTFDVENGDEEEARREEEILARLGLQRSALVDYWGVSLEGLSLNDAGDQVYIRSAIQQAGPALVIFDTGSSMIGDEWGAELKSAIRFVRALAREYGCAIVLVVHLVKPAKAAAGSRAKGKPEANAQHGTALVDVMGQWTRAADTVALMASAGAERVLWTVRKRAPHSQVVLKAEAGTFEVIQVVAGEDLGVGTAERIHGCIATGYADAAAIATYLDVTERTVWRHVAKLREAGRVAPDAPLRVLVPLSVGVSQGVSGSSRTNGHPPTADVSDVSAGSTDTVSPPVGGDMVSVSVEAAP